MRLIGYKFRLLVESFLRPRIQDEDVAFLLQPKGKEVQYFLFRYVKFLVSLFFRYFPCLFGVLQQVIANICLYFWAIPLEVLLVVADDGGVLAGEEVDHEGMHVTSLHAFLLLSLVYCLQVLVWYVLEVRSLVSHELRYAVLVEQEVVLVLIGALRLFY